jgi:beta-glucosidase
MHNLLIPGAAPEEFLWASGIENTFVPQARAGMRALDEYELMGHYEHWREDLGLARELGLGAMRWGIPWYRVEPNPGSFDWSWTDRVLPFMVEELGITPILDLMHYGTPLWLDGSFAAEDYPQRVAAYARAVAERYKGLLRYYTPLNEPLVNALFCGRRGLWPPYLRGDGGYLRVMLNLARGIVQTVEAIRAVQHDAVMVHVEASVLSRFASEDLAPLAAEEQLRGFLCLDLITGKVGQDHPLITWLLRNGVRPDELRELRRAPLTLDLLGLNFYPQWATLEVTVNQVGRLHQRKVEKDGSGFGELIELYQRRYDAPVMITETSAVGDDRLRSRWLTASLAAIKGLRARGVPVLGYTWFPLFTMVDWRYRFGKRPIEEYYLDLGLYTLQSGADERWRATPLVAQFQQAVANPAEAVGALHREPHATHVYQSGLP